MPVPQITINGNGEKAGRQSFSPMSFRDRYLLGILTLALILRFFDLCFPPHFPQPDEYFSLEAASQASFRETIRYVAGDTHPPLYFLVLRAWLRIFPPIPFSTKILSILFNVTNILFTYHIALVWVDRKTARLAAFVMALSPWNIYWSHLARNHQMLPPLFTLSSWSLLAWLRSDSKRFPLVYCLFTMLMVQTNYLAFFILATHGVIALWECRGKIRRIFILFAAQLTGILSYAPLFPMLVRHIQEGPMNAGFPQHTVSPIYLFFHFIFFNLFTDKLGDLWYPPPSSMILILSGGTVIALAGLKAVKRLCDPGFYLLLLVPITLTLIFAKIKGTTMAERYLAYAIGPFAILLAAGLAEWIEQGRRYLFKRMEKSRPSLAQ